MTKEENIVYENRKGLQHATQECDKQVNEDGQMVINGALEDVFMKNIHKVGDKLSLKKEVHEPELNHDIEVGELVFIIGITEKGYDIETVDEGIQVFDCDWDIFS